MNANDELKQMTDIRDMERQRAAAAKKAMPMEVLGIALVSLFGWWTSGWDTVTGWWVLGIAVFWVMILGFNAEPKR